MLQFSGLGQADVCSDSPCFSTSCPGYDADVCAAIYGIDPSQIEMDDVNVAANPSPTANKTSMPAGITCGAGAYWEPATGSCLCPPSAPIWDDTAQTCTASGTDASPGMQLAPVTPMRAPMMTASLPASGKMLLGLLALAGAAGIGWYAVKRARRA